MIQLRRHAPYQLLAILLVLASDAAGQTVVGRVVDRETLEPIPAAFVVLETLDGQRHRGVLSGRDGRFVLRAGAPGSYRVTAQMIGYASPPAESVELESGKSVELTVRVPPHAIALEGIAVTAGARCRPRPGSGPETARLWEEARKALEVTSWAEKTAAVRLQGVRFERRLDPATYRAQDATERGWTGWFNRSPYASVPADELAAYGYVRQWADGSLTYYSPDADVLLSDLFLDSHCFHVAEGAGDDAGLVGLAFEPVRVGRVPDIRGALWLDRQTGELRRLDFSYTHLPGPVWEARRPGEGRVEFQRLETGVWIVSRWWIRMPLVEVRHLATTPARREVVVVALQESGGEVRSVLGRDARPNPEAGDRPIPRR